MKKLTSLLALGVTTLGGALLGAEAEEHSEWDLKGLDASKLPAVATASGLTYVKDIKPILEASCFRCHGEDRQRGDLRLDSREALLKGGEHGKMVKPGKSAESLLVFSAAQSNDEIAMPPKGRQGGSPGGRGRGEFQPPPEVLKEFDKNKDGELNEEERQAMFESFRARRGQGGPGGPQAPGAQEGARGPRGDGGPGGRQGGGRGPGGQREQGRGPGGAGGPGGPGGRGFGGGPPAQPLTAEQVGIIRAWIDQGAK